MKMVWPTESHTITQRYGNPSARYVSGRHTGLDIGGKTGDAIWAAHDGRVIRAGWNGPYGNEVAVQHSSGLVTSYHHMSRIDVTLGRVVSAGTRLGSMGSTGNSTGPHLHFEVRINNKHTDPMPYLNGAGVVPVGTNPLVPDVVEDPLSAFSGVFDFFTDPTMWLRLGMVLGGFVLLAFGFVGIAKTNALGKSAISTIGKAVK